jgi:hypothetical protein
MKLSLKSINGKLRILAQRIEQGLKFVADCCCINQGEPNLILFLECCDSVPRFAVTRQAYDILVQRCPRTVDLPLYQPLIVKINNAENEACYREGDITQQITREEAVRLGYTIYDNPDSFRCSRGDNAPSRLCGWSECRECYPNQCCLTELYDKECSYSFLVPNSTPKKNICCNYGRKLRRRATYTQTIQRSRWTFLNNSVQSSFCNVGCYSPLPRERFFEQLSYNIEDEFTKCDDLGQPLGGVDSWNQTNIRNDRSYRIEDIFTRYGFDGDVNLPTCMSSRDEVRASLQINDNDIRDNNRIFPFFWPGRTQRVQSQALPPRDNCFGFWFLTPFTQDGSIITSGAYIPYGPTQLQCDDVFGHVYECVIAYGAYRLRIITDRYQYGTACDRGQYILSQTIEVIANRPQGWPENEPLCPAQGTLLERIRVDVSCTYFIESVSRSWCNPRTCDGYARTGTISPIPFPIIPQPIQGALSLL